MPHQPRAAQDSTHELWGRNQRLHAIGADAILILSKEGIEVHDMKSFPAEDYMQRLKELGITAEEERHFYCG